MKGWKWERKKEKKKCDLWSSLWKGIRWGGGGGGGFTCTYICCCWFLMACSVSVAWEVKVKLWFAARSNPFLVPWNTSDTHVWLWQKGEERDLEPTDTIEIIDEPKRSTVNCKSGVRKDTGEYYITIANKHGSDSASISVVVLGQYRLYMCISSSSSSLSLCPCFKYLFGWFYVSGSPMKVPLKKISGWLAGLV